MVKTLKGKEDIARTRTTKTEVLFIIYTKIREFISE